MSTRPVAKPAKGLRRLERWMVGVVMSIVAFALERIVMHSVKKKNPDTVPVPTTLRSKGGEVDFDES